MFALAVISFGIDLLWLNEMKINTILEICHLHFSPTTGVRSVDNKEWICRTCHNNLKQDKIPTCSKANGMGFSEKSSVLDLTILEERLIAPRIPFMQIRQLPRRQLCIHVPADVNTTVTLIRRAFDESQTISVKLKRKKGYKG